MGIVDEISKISREEVTVYVAEIDLKVILLLEDDYNFEVLLRNFPLAEQLKIRSKLQPGASKREIVNRIFSRVLLNLLTGKEKEFIKEINFQYNEYGKPSVDGLQFNISTSNDIISLIVQGTSQKSLPVGIDLSHSIQKVDPSTCVEDFRGIFHKDEYDFLVGIDNQEERYEIFNQLWTLKEAYTKYLGVGLNVDLSKSKFDIKGKTVVPLSKSVVVSTGEYLDQLKLDWTQEIDVHSHLSEDTSKNAICRSSKLSPVILTVVTGQSLPPNIRVYRVNMSKLLSYILS